MQSAMSCREHALCLSVGRSRGRKFKLLRILRVIAGWALAFGVSLSVRWVPSEYNASDKPSRGEEQLVQHPHDMSAPAPHRVQYRPLDTDLRSAAHLPPVRSSTIPKRKNDEDTGWTAHGERDNHVPSAAVQTLAPVSKSARKVSRTSMPRFNKSGEAALIQLQNLEKVATTLGAPRWKAKKGLSPRSSTASSGSETPERCKWRPMP